MTSPEMAVTVEVTGPLFDHRADAAVRDFLERAQQVVGEQGLANWQHNMDGSFRKPTPYYETQVIVQRVGEVAHVHDRGIIYGPWLEGTSRRNQTTRFKGYASLRRAVQQLRPRIDPLLGWVLRHGFIQRMGGAA